MQLWRRIGASGGVILEGRDIGTEVFPDADIKFFLDAGQGERASRRFREQGEAAARTLDGVKRELQVRDETDRNRTHSPLRRADDAILVDTTHLTPEETLAILLEKARGRLEEADLT